MHLMGNKIKSFKDNFIYGKDLAVDTISNIKNKNWGMLEFDKVLIKDGLKTMGSGLKDNSSSFVKSFIAASKNNEKFTGKVNILNMHYQFSKPATTAIKGMDRVNSIYNKLKAGINPITVLGNSDIKEIYTIKSQSEKLIKKGEGLIESIKQLNAGIKVQAAN